MKALPTSRILIGIALLLGIFTLTGTASAALYTDVDLAGPPVLPELNLGLFVTGATTVSGTNYSINTNLGLSSGSNTEPLGHGHLERHDIIGRGASVQNNLKLVVQRDRRRNLAEPVGCIDQRPKRSVECLSLTANQTYSAGITPRPPSRTPAARSTPWAATIRWSTLPAMSP